MTRVRGVDSWGVYNMVEALHREVRCFLFAVGLGLLCLGSAVVTGSEPEPLRIAGVDFVGDLPTRVAQRRGFFDETGLDVRVRYSSAGRGALQRLRRGETDFALMTLTPLVIDHLADVSPGGPDDPVIVSNLLYSSRLTRIVTPASSSVQSPQALRGKRVGVMKGTNAELLWWLFATRHGLESASVTLVDVPVESINDYLLAGKIDAAAIWEPWLSRLEARTGTGVHSLPGVEIYSVRWVLVTTRSRLRERRGAVEALLAAYDRAVEWIERHPRQAMRLHADRAGVDPGIVRRYWDGLAYHIDLDWSLVFALQEQMNWAALRGYSVANPEPVAMTLIEPSPLRRYDPLRVPFRGTSDRQIDPP